MSSQPEAIRARIGDRLGAEFDDVALGIAVADRLDVRAYEVFADRPEWIGSSLLSFEPVVQRAPESLVVFAFGNRIANDGALSPGPVNLALARLADDWSQSNRLPVFAQWEVADEMRSESIRVGAVTHDDGTTEYLSTAGVAEQVKGALWPIQTNAGRVAVLAMADHAVRCCRALELVGLSAGIADGVELPSVYDPDSGQPWTRDRAGYLAIDILARCLTQEPDVAT